jgi:uncharacterized membrane protein
MTKTIVALFDDAAAVQQTVSDLVEAGFGRQNISLVRLHQTDHSPFYLTEGETDIQTRAADAPAEGAVAGGLMGGLAGMLVGMTALAIPGVGPIVAAGPLVAGLVGAAAGAATGGLLGALVQWGIPADKAEYYAEGVHRGGTLLAVNTPEQQVEHVVDILNHYHPVDIEARATQWRQEGWAGYDRPTWQIDAQADHEEFHHHYQANYSHTGQPYEVYEPAYRFGYLLGIDARYQDRDWEDIAWPVQQRWQRDHAFDPPWPEVEDIVRYAWQQTRQAENDEPT